MSAVYNAVVSLDHELLLSVLEQGHFVDEPWEEWTPLYALANNVKWHENIPKILKTLLEYGADTNIECEQRLPYRCSTKFYSTPLLEVVCRDYKENEECRVDMILLLINNGANVTYVDTRGVSIICHAARRDHVYVVQLLVASGVSPDDLDEALCEAAYNGNVTVARYLVELGASTVTVSRNGYTAGQFARMSNSFGFNFQRDAFADELDNVAELKRIARLNYLAIGYDRERGRGSRFHGMTEDVMRMILNKI